MVGNAIIDLSNLIWTEGTEPICRANCVLLMQDFDNYLEHSWEKDSGEPKADMNYFLICCGSHRIEDGYTGCIPTYLAVRRRDGGYLLERMEDYMEKREGQLILDILKLPEQINGIKLNRVASAQYPNRNRWRSGDFRRNDGDQGQETWYLEEYS